jgi:hypothetical protein
MFLSSDDFYSGGTLILTTIAVKRCTDICARPHVCGVFLMFLTFILTLTDNLCCAWYIYRILCWYWCGVVVEYLHRDPASRRRRRKGKSQF